MARILALFTLIVLFGGAEWGAADEAKPAKLTDLSWLEGPWKSGPNEKTQAEEHWSAPAGGAMMGMFRLLQGGKPGIYEFLLIEEDADGIHLRLRHYRPQMADVDKAPIRLKLTEATGRKLIFVNPDNDQPKRILYSQESPDQLTATVETTRNGKPHSFTLRMQRSKAK